MVVVKEKIRTRIVKDARKIFIRNGFKTTTMDQIAHATGMGKSSLYYYFPGKEEIFRAVVEFEAEELKIMLGKTLDKADSPTEKLQSYMYFRLHHVRTLGNFYAALKEEQLSGMKFIMDIRTRFDREELDVVRGILEEGMEKGIFQLRSSEIGAIAISTMMKGLEQPLLLSEAHKSDRANLLEDLIRVLFYGVLKR